MPEFRELTLSDFNSCLQIWKELSSHYEHPIGGEWTGEKMKSELENHHGIGAFNDQGEMESFCLYRKASGVREIMLLATRHREHRAGAMRSLIRSLIAELGPEEVLWLEVHAGNLPAISLYESLGMHLCGERPDYYADGGKALLFEYKPLQ